MNGQVSYVIRGFLLALLLPVAGIVMNKISNEVSRDTNRQVAEIDLNEPSVDGAHSSKGRSFFMQKCASCHHLVKEGTGPPLTGFQHRGQWADRDKLHQWIQNPALFMKNDLYTKKLKEKYVVMMTSFPDISKEEVDEIADYIVQSSN